MEEHTRPADAEEAVIGAALADRARRGGEVDALEQQHGGGGGGEEVPAPAAEGATAPVAESARPPGAELPDGWEVAVSRSTGLAYYIEVRAAFTVTLRSERACRTDCAWHSVAMGQECPQHDLP